MAAESASGGARAELALERGKFQTTLTVLIIVFGWSVFDKFIVEPGALDRQRKTLEKAAKEERSDREEVLVGRIRTLEAGIQTSEARKITTLEAEVADLKHRLREAKRDLSAARQRVREAKLEVDAGRSDAERFRAMNVAMEKERDKAVERLRSTKRALDQITSQFHSLDDLTEVLIDNACSQLVRLRKELPPKTPKTVAQRINRILQRIRDTEKEVKKSARGARTPKAGDKPDDKAGEKPDGKPDEKADVKPDEKADEKPNDQPVDKPGDKPKPGESEKRGDDGGEDKSGD